MTHDKKSLVGMVSFIMALLTIDYTMVKRLYEKSNFVVGTLIIIFLMLTYYAIFSNTIKLYYKVRSKKDVK